MLARLASATLSLADFSALGVRRFSVGGLLSRAALGAFLRGASEMMGHGTSSFAGEAVAFRDLNELFE